MDFNNIFKAKLSSITKKSQVLSDIEASPENDSLKVLRTFEDLSDFVDTKLKRRAIDSRKFNESVLAIKNAISNGKFVINIIAPEYDLNKDLVDLIVSTALTDAPKDSYSSIEEKSQDIDKRFGKMNDNIISDIRVSDIIPKVSQQMSIDDYCANLIERSFFGSEYFDEDDSINCCYGYVADYLRSQKEVLDPVSQESTSERLQNRSERDASRYSLVHSPQNIVDFKGKDENNPLGSVQLNNPLDTASQTEAQPRGGHFPGVYFDERVSFLRLDPKNMDSYTYYDLYYDKEKKAQEKIKDILDRGGANLDADFKNKWMTFCYIISAIQGNSCISIFYPPGFNEDGSSKEFSDGSIEDFERVNPEAIKEVIAGFLAKYNISDRNIISEVSESIISDVATAPEVSSGVNLGSMSEQEQIKFFIEKIKSDLGNNPIKLKSVKNWLASNYPDYQDLASNIVLSADSKIPIKTSSNKVFEHLSNSIASTSSYSDVKKWVTNNYPDKENNSLDYFFSLSKVAATEFVEKNPLFTTLSSLLKNNKKFSESFSAVASAEYILKLLIDYIYNLAYSPEVSDEITDDNSLRINNASLRRSSMSKTLIILFGPAEQAKFGIASDDDFKRVFSNGTFLTIISDNGDSETKKIVSASVAQLRSSFVPIPYNNNGPYCILTFDSAVQNNFESGHFRIYLKKNSSQINGLFNSVYSIMYGQDAKKIMDIHKKNGISVNCSLYPSWIPAPLDYRPTSEGSIGHPNNASNIKKVLEDRIALRSRILREMSYGRKNEIYYKSALQRVNQEIGEIQMVLYEYAAFRYSTVRGELGKDKDIYKSMMRKSYNDEEFFREVKYRCLKEGIYIGEYNKVFDSDIIKGFLSSEDFQKFEKIKNDVANTYKERKNLTIIRGIDHGLSPNKGNGFVNLKQQMTPTGDGKETETQNTVWSSKFQSLVQRLHSAISGQAGASGADIKKQNNCLICISDERLPKLVEEIEYIYLPTNVISYEEIESFINFYATIEKNRYIEKIQSVDLSKYPEQKRNIQEQKRQVAIKKVKDFVVPTSFIRLAQNSLSDFKFQIIDNYLQKTVSEIFNMYLKSEGNLIEVMDVNRIKFRQDMEALKTSDSDLKQMGVRSSPPSYTLNEYATATNSVWAGHVHGDSADSLATLDGLLRSNEDKINFLIRCFDSGVYFGAFNISKDGVVDFYIPSENSPKKMVWFNKNPLVDVQPDSVLKQLSMASQYDIHISFANEIKDKRYSMYNIPTNKQANNSLDNFKKYATLNLTINQQSINSYGDKLKLKAFELEEENKTIKQKYPVLLVLEGDPGTGKSIYPEVVASTLGCKYLHTTFESIFYSGDPKFRGELEKNVEKFFNWLTTLKDTVLLIDEVDKFLTQNSLSGSSNDVNMAIGRMQNRWDLNADFPIYSNNNLHIILTTNFWDRIAKQSSALASRTKRYKVELPTDKDALKKLLIEGGIINNLINSHSGGDPIISSAIKDILRLSEGKTNADKEIIKQLVERVEKISPGFFSQKAILKPRDAARKWSESKGIIYKDEVDVVQDYIAGFTMMSDLLLSLSKPVEIQTVNGPKQIIPLEKVCETIHEQTIYRGKNKAYARASMRDLMRLLEEMFASHQSFLEGSKSLPFNYKTLLAALSENVFQQKVEDEKIDPEDRKNPEFMKELNAESKYGFKKLFRLAVSTRIDNKIRPPIEFWSTRDQYAENMKRQSDLLKSSGMQNKEAGDDFLINQVANALFIDSESMGKNLADLNIACKKSASNRIKGAIIFNKFLDKYIQVKNRVKVLFDTYESSKNKDAIEEIKYLSLLITSIYTAQISDTVPLIRQYLITLKNSVFMNTFVSLTKGLRKIDGSLDLVNILSFSLSDGYDPSLEWDNKLKKAQLTYDHLQKSGFAFSANKALRDFLYDRELSEQDLQTLFKDDDEEFSIDEQLSIMDAIEDKPYLLQNIPLEIRQRMEKRKTEIEKVKTQKEIDDEKQKLMTETEELEGDQETKDIVPQIVDKSDDEDLKAFDEIDLNKKTSTDYYYKIANKFIREMKIAQIQSIPYQNGDTLFFNMDIKKMLQSYEFFEKQMANITKEPYQTDLSADVSKINFI